MKNHWIFFSILPIAAFAGGSDGDLFYIADEKDQALLHISFDAEDDFDESLSDTIGSLDLQDYDTSSLSLLEMDENDRSLLPWAPEGLSENFSVYVERRAKEIEEDFDNVFAYELPAMGQKKEYEPTHEKVPRERSLFGKPRVVPSRERQNSYPSHKADKKSKQSLAEKKNSKKKNRDLVIKNE